MIRITKDGNLNQRDVGRATVAAFGDAIDFVQGLRDEEDCASRVEAAMDRIEWAMCSGTALEPDEVY